MTLSPLTQFIEKCREIERGATPGPWNKGRVLLGDSGQYSTLGTPTHERMPDMLLLKDAMFIAHARNTHAKLLAMLETAVDALEAVHVVWK